MVAAKYRCADRYPADLLYRRKHEIRGLGVWRLLVPFAQVVGPGMFLTAERRFQKLSALPDAVSDPKVNLAWWEALEHVYEREKVIWRLFVGSQPSLEQNKLYARFRTMLLKGSSLKASA